MEVHSNAETHSGAEAHSGNETHSGAETHSGIETHSNAETHSGAESHSGAEVFTGVPVFTAPGGHGSLLLTPQATPSGTPANGEVWVDTTQSTVSARIGGATTPLATMTYAAGQASAAQSAAQSFATSLLVNDWGGVALTQLSAISLLSATYQAVPLNTPAFKLSGTTLFGYTVGTSINVPQGIYEVHAFIEGYFSTSSAATSELLVKPQVLNVSNPTCDYDAWGQAIGTSGSSSYGAEPNQFVYVNWNGVLDFSVGSGTRNIALGVKATVASVVFNVKSGNMLVRRIA